MPNLRKKFPPVLWEVAGALQPDEVRLVGGAVRDYLRNELLPDTDYDMATTAVPDVVIKRLEQAGIKVVPTGISHGTVTAVVEDKNIEITTLRKDIATDGRHAQVRYTDSWQEDSARRDFTMNAVYLGLDGHVYDFCQGVEDIQAGRVVFVGDPQERVQEDTLRILRFFRFMARYGVSAESATLKILVKAAPQMKHLSGERVTDELMKLLMAPQAAAALSVMKRLRILAPLGIEIKKENLLEGTALPLMGRWYIVFGPNPGPYVILSRARQQAVKDIKTAQELLKKNRLSPKALVAAVSWDAAATALTARGRWVEAEQLKGEVSPTFPLKGQDVLDLGIKPGPQVGTLVEQARLWWLQEGFPSHRACLEQVKRVIRTEQKKRKSR
jgi:tRNA nucleotidyltransferase/poly(A) polymerase